MNGIKQVALPAVSLGSQRQSGEGPNVFGIEIDLAPERIVGRFVIAKGDIAAIPNQMNEAGAGKAVVQHRKRINSLAKLPSPRPAGVAAQPLEMFLENAPDEPGKFEVGSRPRIPQS